MAPCRPQGRLPIWQNNLEHTLFIFCIGYISQWSHLKSILSASWTPVWNNIGTRTDYCSHQLKSLLSLTDLQTLRYGYFISCLTHPAHVHDLIHKDIMTLYKMLFWKQGFQCLYHSLSKNLFFFFRVSGYFAVTNICDSQQLLGFSNAPEQCLDTFFMEYKKEIGNQ